MSPSGSQMLKQYAPWLRVLVVDGVESRVARDDSRGVLTRELRQIPHIVNAVTIATLLMS